MHWLEGYLERYKGAVVAVTHDRYFLDNVAGWILEVDKGQCLPYQGNYTSWLEHKASNPSPNPHPNPSPSPNPNPNPNPNQGVAPDQGGRQGEGAAEADGGRAQVYQVAAEGDAG